MPIYEGATPPVVNGCYVISPTTLVYASDNISLSHQFADLTFCFFNQSTTKNSLGYKEKQNDATATSDEVSIIGEDDNFTAYFISTGYSNNISVKTATVISGTRYLAGFKNIYYSFVLLEKGSDPDTELMDEGGFRSFTDGSGIAAATQWSSASLKKVSGRTYWQAFDKASNK